MTAPYLDNKTLTGAYQALAATRLIMSITIAADPANASDALLRVAGGSPIALPPGKLLPLAGVDLSTVQVKCDDGGRVLVAGPASIQNARRQARLIAAGSPAPAPLVEAGGPYTTTNAGPVQLAGTAENVESLQWETSGDGTFDDENSLTAIYTPGPADQTAGAGQNVTLTLIGVVGGLGVVDDDANLGVTITGTYTARVANDAVSFDGAAWPDADGAIYPTDEWSGRVRFAINTTDLPPSGATMTGVSLRMTGGTGDTGTRHLNIRAFNAGGGALSGVFTLEPIGTAVPLVDDLTEKTLAVNTPISWTLGANILQNALDIRLNDEFSSAVIACSLGDVEIDLYADIAWSKAPPSP